MLTTSLNTLAEKRELPEWSTWKDGRPPGFFRIDEAEEAAAFYQENGFLVITDGLTQAEVDELRADCVQICRGNLGTFSGLMPLDQNLTDDEIIKNYLCIHFPHKLSPVMERYVAHQAFVKVLTKVIGPDVKCMQSMLFIKSAGKPGQAWHQDEFYIPTRDRSLTGGWIALDDAHVGNGCLWVIPKSHKTGVLYEQEWHADPRFDCSHEARGYPWTNDDAVPVEVKAGSIVFFNGYLLHRSLPNYGEVGFRRSLVNHYMSAQSLLPWFPNKEENTPIGQLDVRDIVMVAGQDPYAHKGVKDIHGGHVRSDGKGGCGNYEYNLKKPQLPPGQEDDH